MPLHWAHSGSAQPILRDQADINSDTGVKITFALGSSHLPKIHETKNMFSSTNLGPLNSLKAPFPKIKDVLQAKKVSHSVRCSKRAMQEDPASQGGDLASSLRSPMSTHIPSAATQSSEKSRAGGLGWGSQRATQTVAHGYQDTF